MRHWDSPAAMSELHLNFFTLRALKIQSVETLAGKAFQSRPHNIIHETLGQSSSYGLDEKLPTDTDSASYSGDHN
eukprot:scaffold25748_cov49-Cyclotella_meneghiniana.AAC.1